MTPKSYLELLKLYGNLLAEKRTAQEANINRLSNGLTKLRETAKSVAQLQTDLAIMVEAAEKKKEVSEGIAEVVAREKAIVEVMHHTSHTAHHTAHHFTTSGATSPLHHFTTHHPPPATRHTR